MTRMIVDIKKISEKEMEENMLIYPYRVTAYVYETEKIIRYGVDEEDVLKMKIGKIF